MHLENSIQNRKKKPSTIMTSRQKCNEETKQQSNEAIKQGKDQEAATLCGGRVKQERAQGGCLGARSRRKTRQAAKSRGEGQMPCDPRVSEWGNPRGGNAPRIRARIHKARRGTRRTETSK